MVFCFVLPIGGIPFLSYENAGNLYFVRGQIHLFDLFRVFTVNPGHT